MASINMASIKGKVEAFTKGQEGKKKVNTALRNVTFGLHLAKGGGTSNDPNKIAAQFVAVMMDAINSSLSGTAVDAASNFSSGTPTTSEVGGETVVTIPFNFGGDLHRDSLYPARYGGIDNIVAYLNHGRKQTENTVFGLWHGNKIWGVKSREGAGFVQTAVRQFWDRYASEYNILSIEVSGEYK